MVFFAILGLSGACARSPSAASTQEALEIFDRFQTQLLLTLKSTIEANGAPAAITHCKTASPELEKQVSANGWTVRRVSDRPRNPDHMPDGFEMRVIARWQEEMKSGRKIQQVAEIEKGRLRVMRPIVIQADLCLRCHGQIQAMEPAVAKQLAEQYPADKAVGYSLGDLRGAFSASRAAE